MISETSQLGRATNVLLPFFEARLSVPKIYFDTTWDGSHVDVLAIDRDGVGDVHVVLIFPRSYPEVEDSAFSEDHAAVRTLISKLALIQANYKYVAAAELRGKERPRTRINPDLWATDEFFAPDGFGRVGLLQVDLLPDDEPTTKVILRPERFRAKIAEIADTYVQHHTADWEIRA